MNDNNYLGYLGLIGEQAVTVTKCAACGFDHKMLVYPLKPDEQYENSGLKYTHYGICPSTWEVVYVAWEKA